MSVSHAIRYRLPVVNDELGHFLVTVSVVIGGFYLIATKSASPEAMFGVMGVTVGHYFGRSQDRSNVKERATDIKP